MHVFYVPELESISDTKEKLLQRQKEVAIRIKKNQKDMLNPNVDQFLPKYVNKLVHGNIKDSAYYIITK